MRRKCYYCSTVYNEEDEIPKIEDEEGIRDYCPKCHDNIDKKVILEEIGDIIIPWDRGESFKEKIKES